MKNFHKKAFSLVELSMVILIIGILIAGVSQGIDLYQDMRLATARSLTLNSRVNRIEDLTMWFEATSEKSFENPNPKDEERIALWKNINLKLSNRIDVVQTTTNYKPFYVRKAINGIPALRFDGSQNLSSNYTKISDIIDSNQATVFIVQNNFSGKNNTSAFALRDAQYRFHVGTQNKNKIMFDFGVCCNPASRTETEYLTTFLNNNKILTFVKNGSNAQIKISSNEVVVNSNVASDIFDNSDYNYFIIGAFPSINSYFFGYIGELIVFKRALTDAEINDVEKYLSKKWAIKIN
jgi:prepilin-type N-terminal cleavage/methylation domain-containing protein